MRTDYSSLDGECPALIRIRHPPRALLLPAIALHPAVAGERARESGLRRLIGCVSAHRGRLPRARTEVGAGRGGARRGGAGGRKTHSTSMLLVCLRSPGSKFSTVLSSSSLWHFTMTSVRDLGGRGRIGSVTWTRTRSYTCRCTCSMCNVNVTFVGYRCRSMIQCDLIVCSFVLELWMCCENRLSECFVLKWSKTAAFAV